MITSIDASLAETTINTLRRRVEQWAGVGPFIGGVSNNIKYAAVVNYGGLTVYEDVQNPSRPPGVYTFTSGVVSRFEGSTTAVFRPGAHMIELSKGPVNQFMLANLSGNVMPRAFTPHHVKTVMNKAIDLQHGLVSKFTPVDTGTLRRGWEKKYV